MNNNEAQRALEPADRMALREGQKLAILKKVAFFLDKSFLVFEEESVALRSPTGMRIDGQRALLQTVVQNVKHEKLGFLVAVGDTLYSPKESKMTVVELKVALEVKGMKKFLGEMMKKCMDSEDEEYSIDIETDFTSSHGSEDGEEDEAEATDDASFQDEGSEESSEPKPKKRKRKESSSSSDSEEEKPEAEPEEAPADVGDASSSSSEDPSESSSSSSSSEDSSDDSSESSESSSEKEKPSKKKARKEK